MINLRPLLKVSRNTFDAFTAFWIAIILLLNVPIFFDFMTDSVHAPKFYYVAIALAGVYFLIRPTLVLEFIKHPLFHWMVFYVTIMAFAYLRLHSTDVHQDFIDYEFDQIQRVIMLAAVSYILWNCKKSYFRWLFPIACVIVCAANIIDFLSPGMMAPPNWPVGHGRADGFYINANAAAEAAMLTVLLCRNYGPKILFPLLYGLAGIAIVVTFSRSGMAIWFCTGIVLFFTGKLPKYFLLVPVLAIVIVSIFTSQIESVIRSFPEYEYSAENMLNRLTFFKDTGDGGITSQAEEDIRAQIALDALVASFEAPIFGHGVDYIESQLDVRAHNLIISLFHKYGIFGIILWGWLLRILWNAEKRENGIFALGTMTFFLFSFFTHNILENVY